MTTENTSNMATREIQKGDRVMTQTHELMGVVYRVCKHTAYVKLDDGRKVSYLKDRLMVVLSEGPAPSQGKVEPSTCRRTNCEHMGHCIAIPGTKRCTALRSPQPAPTPKALLDTLEGIIENMDPGYDNNPCVSKAEYDSQLKTARETLKALRAQLGVE